MNNKKLYSDQITEKIFKINEEILKSIEFDEFEQVYFLCQNRERLLSILKLLINDIQLEEAREDKLKQFKKCFHDTNEKILYLLNNVYKSEKKYLQNISTGNKIKQIYNKNKNISNSNSHLSI